MSYLVSTKGRYALRIMIDMAEQEPDVAVPLKDIANRQALSLKYLESIMPNLKEHGLVTAVAGKGGGYKLTKPASEYTVGEILRVSEDQIAPVACLNDGFVCTRADTCKTLPMWRKLDSVISDYLDTVKLTDLL
ncbi:MAG: Rrf2 family transcriptional regulator [Candidatus Methanomethylophilaceae archaeon]|nr:Rrf2 family transcriptional regulator [Candidatus Methanomethylophilaceae archaeon]MBQ7978889.1 Rrf2 family transcriptional regulator [Candidatus Methanomethylophilaceae archaeon]MBR6911454.1 Rrf2 family transcriptional regulator [Candidatus Methanomethylophilaceae archaeon]